MYSKLYSEFNIRSYSISCNQRNTSYKVCDKTRLLNTSTRRNNCDRYALQWKYTQGRRFTQTIGVLANTNRLNICTKNLRYFINKIISRESATALGLCRKNKFSDMHPSTRKNSASVSRPWMLSLRHRKSTAIFAFAVARRVGRWSREFYYELRWNSGLSPFAFQTRFINVRKYRTYPTIFFIVDV